MAYPITDAGGDQKQDYYLEWPKSGIAFACTYRTTKQTYRSKNRRKKGREPTKGVNYKQWTLWTKQVQGHLASQ